MPRTRPEVNPKISVPKKKLVTKAVGSVGVSLARGKYAFGDGEVKGFGGIFSRRGEKRTLMGMGEGE
jgi:hypothetical protein